MTYKGAPLMSERQNWGTPDSFMQYLRDQFMFTPDVDLCASKSNTKASKYYCEDNSCLSQIDWNGKNYWMNPPFGKELPLFIEKVEEQFNKGNIERAMVLVPARTDTKWFHNMMKGNVHCCYFIKGRFNFVHPDLNCSGANAPFPSILVEWKKPKNIFDYSLEPRFETLELTTTERGF